MLNELKDLSLDLKKKIKDYSTFDLVMIGEVFAKIMNHYENEEYSYQQTHYFCVDNAVGGGMLFVAHPAFIIKDCVKKRFYSYNTDDLDTLIQEGNGLILIDDLENSTADTIDFYTFNNKTGELKLNICFRKFVYLKRFINEVISYKLKNNITNISTQELEKLMNEFIGEISKKLIKN